MTVTLDLPKFSKKIQVLLAKGITDSQVLKELSESEYEDVRTEVGRNVNTLPQTLDKLSSDNKASVRLAVAENRFALPETLYRLACDENVLVREKVIYNPKIPKFILNKLCQDPAITVSTKAWKRLERM